MHLMFLFDVKGSGPSERIKMKLDLLRFECASDYARHRVSGRGINMFMIVLTFVVSVSVPPIMRGTECPVGGIMCF